MWRFESGVVAYLRPFIGPVALLKASAMPTAVSSHKVLFFKLVPKIAYAPHLETTEAALPIAFADSLFFVQQDDQGPLMAFR